MSTPGASEGAPTCPTCDSERIESLEQAVGTAELTHRCLDCETEFDETGGRISP